MSPGTARGPSAVDPGGGIDRLLRDLRSSRTGLTAREAARRLEAVGPNELVRRAERGRLRELAEQFTHPLALLLWLGAVLAAAAGIIEIAVAIVIVIVLNAVFAYLQERQAERAVEALADYLPASARVLRDGTATSVPARALVPGDVILPEEGDRVSADARLIEGAVEVDMSPLTGESTPVERAATAPLASGPPIDAPELIFSGTACTAGEAQAVVFATGMHTEIGRIAALSQRARREESPLEAQVRRVAWVIAAIALITGLIFVPLTMLATGLPLSDAGVFAIGLIVGNVPEGLLPVITLALALGVREMARRGAVVKRLSAVETLGSVDVICTDKTGTLTLNRMQPVKAWTAGEEIPLEATSDLGPHHARERLALALALCGNAELRDDGASHGDPTEVALLLAARRMGARIDPAERTRGRVGENRFDPRLKLMSTLDRVDGRFALHVKGAPEAVLARCSRFVGPEGERPLDADSREMVERLVARSAAEGLRLLAVAERRLATDQAGAPRDLQEQDLVLLGTVALIDPPRAEVMTAVEACHTAGIRIIMVTGDHPATSEAIARRVGIVRGPRPRVVTERELDEMPEQELDDLLREAPEVIFARSTPEAKLRIADALRHGGHVVAMTGDGVNDAPALRRADIGVAMGLGGTDVAREAATIVLTDDNFSSIVAAVAVGRRIFANIRKFVFYIFAHLLPELAPYMVFALSGGQIPLALPVLLLLCIDVGTEILPALALSREPAEPGAMLRAPRRQGSGIVDRFMIWRAWAYLGLISAALSMGAFFYVLLDAGWRPGDAVGEGSPLHGAYLQATTITFVAVVYCQVGTALAARTEHASLRQIGLLTNPALLWGIASELALAAAIVYLPPLQSVLHTSALPVHYLLLMLPFPLLVWGADELLRAERRRRFAQGSISPRRTA